MKKELLAALLLGAISSQALATLTFYDPFNYTDVGTTLSTHTDQSFSPNQKWFESGTSDPKIAAGSLSYPGLPASTGNSIQISNTSGASRVQIGSYPEGSTVYYSLIFQVTNLASFTNTTTGSFLTGLNYQSPISDGGMTDTVQNSMAAISIHKAAGAAYNLGIADRDAPAASTRVFGTTAYTTSDTLFLVCKCVIGPGNKDDVASLYINPSAATFGGADPNNPTVVSANSAGSSYYDYFYNTDGTRSVEAGGLALTSVESMILRNNSVEPNSMLVDELRVGTTWADVTRAPIPGDANDDGKVNADDYALIDRGFNQHLAPGLAHYSDGDFNFDGVVDQNDYLLIDQQYLSSGGHAPELIAEREAQFGPGYVSELIAAVPEPASIVTMLVPMLMCARQRGRRM